MITEIAIALSVQLILILFTLYAIFFTSWLKSLGSEFAKLSTTEDLTIIIEKVKKDFNESIENYKSQLNLELSTRIEPLKAELSKNNISHQIQYSFLHQKRAEVLIELYKKLQELQSAMTDWTKTIQPIYKDAEEERKARNARAHKALFDFNNFYIPNKIFFTKTFCESIDELITFYMDKGWDFGYAQDRILEGNLSPDYFKDYSKELSAISKEFRSIIPAKIIALEDIIRNILNVEADEQK